jgi:hypothetical protein
MPRRFTALVLVVLVGRLFLVAPIAEGQEEATPIADAAAREATRAVSSAAKGPMRPGLLWTGVGLIIGSGIPFVATALDGCRSSARTCRTVRRVGYGMGAAMAGTGVLLIGLAHARRGAAGPSVTIDGDRAIVQQRFTF